MKLFRLTAISVVLTTAAIFSLMCEVKAAQINSSIPINTVSPDLANQIQKTLDRSVRETEIPGAVIGIIGSEGTWFGTSGVSNLETGTAMPIDGLFATGSIGKTFTAVAALKLQDQGKLNLDDTLGKWLPDVASNIPDGNSITIRQLLNGSAGIYDFTDEWQADVIKDPSLLLRQSPEDLLVTYAYGKPRFEGRTCTPIWCYTNTSSMIAGLAMEKATGSSFNSIVRSQIFAPLELDSTFAGGEQPFPPGLVESYGDINGDNQLSDDQHRATCAAGNFLHGAADDVTVTRPANILVPGMGAHDDQIDVLLARLSQNGGVRSASGTIDHTIVDSFELLGIGVFHLLLDPGRVVFVGGLLFAGPEIDDKGAGPAGGDAEDMKCVERGVVLFGQVKGDPGRIIARR